MTEQNQEQSFEEFKQWAEHQDARAAAHAAEAQAEVEHTQELRKITAERAVKDARHPDLNLDNEIESSGQWAEHYKNRGDLQDADTEDYRHQVLKFLKRRFEHEDRTRAKR